MSRITFATGRIAAKRKPTCRAEHIGPFCPVEPDYAAWMRGMEAQFDLPRMEYVLCRHCGSHTSHPIGRAA